MLPARKLNIWLSYVSYPVTTAVYFERALRKMHNVTTVGPVLPDELIKGWQLENMKLPIKVQDIDTGFEPDIKALLEKTNSNNYPDLLLWVESVYGFFPKNIPSLGIPTACYLIDSHLSLNWHVEWAKNFDYVYIAQKEYIPAFKAAGNKNVFWLPLGCDPEIHCVGSLNKIYDVGFVGSINNIQTRRIELLKKIQANYPLAYRRCFWKEMSEFFAHSKIVFNNAIKNDLNMRLFEVLSAGSFLLTDMTHGNGQAEMFYDGSELGIYDDENILAKIEYYLKHDDERETIAKRGQQIVHKAHTYANRMEELLLVTFGNKQMTPSPEEWRARSEEKVMMQVPVEKEINEEPQINKTTRSFVIPVLDMSPASPYNIEKLLDDLEDISGDVIVVFNSIEMADKLKSHPRIDYSAILSSNVGVSRAWNIGLNISEADVTFILNSDLHIEKEAVDVIEKYLMELPDAAIAGPQGSFFDFNVLKDILYFDKGTFDKPVAVDGVSGFFFAVKTDLFNNGSLKFDNIYTPCYFEEWDIGLQCRLMGYKCYAVPVTGYEHEWSGSIRSLSKIDYMNREEGREEIYARNRTQFQFKWLNVMTSSNVPNDFLESLWADYAGEIAKKFEMNGNPGKSEEIYNLVLSRFSNNKRALSELGMLAYAKGDLEKTLEYFDRIALIDPDYKVPLSLQAEQTRDEEAIVIDKKKISGIDLSHLLNKTASEDNKKYMSLPHGEHYKFLSYISSLFEDILIFDVGTNYGGSALALSDNAMNKVVSYDIVPICQIKNDVENIELRIGDVLEDERLLNAGIILLDTMHDGTFENRFYKYLVQNNYKGILLLDDIHLNQQMENFWANIQTVKYDLTDVGHLTGTGLVDFTGRVTII